MEDHSNLDQISYKNEYTFKISNQICTVGIALLVGIITGMLIIMSTNESNILAQNSPVFTLYLSIIVVLISLLFLAEYGIIVALVSSLLFCFALKLSFPQIIYNIFINGFQSVLILVFIKNCHKIFKLYKDKNKISSFNIFICVLGISYATIAFFGKHTCWTLLTFMTGIILCYIIISIIDKNFDRITFLIFICLLPNLISGLLNSLYIDGVWLQVNFILNSTFIWAATNFILLSTIGYLVLIILPSQHTKKEKEQWLIVKSSTILFYVSLLFWNTFFFGMYLKGWLLINTATYIFPWFIGNIFFILNLFTSIKEEYNSRTESELFDWYEKRAIVAEKNTHMLIQIITLLLPICATIMKSIPSNIVIVFVLNISTAVASIGLIWIPQNNVKLMALIKTLKTVFHLLTISLLLLSTIMIINNASIVSKFIELNN